MSVHETQRTPGSDDARAREGATTPRVRTRVSGAPPALPRDAGIRRRDGQCFADRHGRDAAACRGSAQLARGYAETLARVWQSLADDEIVLGREAGPRLLNRLATSRETLLALAKRDREWADALDALAEWDERERDLVSNREVREQFRERLGVST